MSAHRIGARWSIVAGDLHALALGLVTGAAAGWAVAMRTSLVTPALMMAVLMVVARRLTSRMTKDAGLAPVVGGSTSALAILLAARVAGHVALRWDTPAVITGVLVAGVLAHLRRRASRSATDANRLE